MAVNLSLNSPNSINLWSAYQNVLLFEEPTPRWRLVLKSDCQDWHKLKKLFQQSLSVYKNEVLADFCPTAIVLAEGMTEQILLPYFARLCGIDLFGKGIMIVSAGGAKKILRKYLYLKDRINLPIFSLFDRDAEPLAQKMMPHLRESDRVHVLADGEIEDLLSLDFLVNRINHYLSINPLYDRTEPVLLSDFTSAEKRTFILEKIWRQRELGKFEKVKFAQFVVNQGQHGCGSNELISQDCKHMLEILARVTGSKE